MRLTINRLMHRARYALAGVALLFWIYINLFMWLAVPFAEFGYRWIGDMQLRVWGIDTTSPVARLLAEDDVILAVLW